MRRVLAGAAAVVALLISAPAEAAILEGSSGRDAEGDARDVNDSHPRDLEYLKARYDDAEGQIRFALRFYDEDEPPPPDAEEQVWELEARVGFHRNGDCDSAAAGSIVMLVHGGNGTEGAWVTATFEGVGGSLDSWNGGATITEAATSSNEWVFTLSDRSLVRAGYSCVENAYARFPARDDVSPFCLGPCSIRPGGGGGDTGRLSIRWTSPRDGQTLKGMLREKGEGRQKCLTTTTGTVIETEIRVDGRLNDRQVQAPWGCELDTREYSNGRHTLTVKAIGPNGTTATDTINVRFDNSRSELRPLSPPDTEGGPNPGSTLRQADPSPTAPGSPGQPTRPAGKRATQTLIQAKRRATTALKRGATRRAFAKRRSGTYRVRCPRTARSSHLCRVSWLTRDRRYSGVVAVRDVTDKRDWTYTARIRSRSR